jgi:predicted DNA-binding transcriptional regulator AlpA
MTNPNDNSTPEQGVNRIRSLREYAELNGISIATLRRLIRTGEGPTTTRLSTRRVGVRDDHGRQWQDARAVQR